MQGSSWLKPSDPKWAKVLDSMEHDVYHLPAYVENDVTWPGQEPGAYMFENGDGALLMPLVYREIPGTELKDAASPYGYPGPVFRATSRVDAQDFLLHAIGQMREFLVEQGVIALFARMHPVISLPLEAFREAGTLVVHGSTISVDLSKSDEEMWSDLRQNHRRGINKARRAGAEFHYDVDWSDFDALVELYESTMRRQNAAGHYYFPREYFAGLSESLGEAFRLLSVTLNGEVISAGVFSECNGIVQYHLSGSNEGFLHLQPLKLLLHEAGKWAKARGNRLMHLGGGVGGEQDSLFAFKAGFSKQTRLFHTWRLITDPNAYDELVRRRGMDPETLDQSGFFPAYRRPVS